MKLSIALLLVLLGPGRLQAGDGPSAPADPLSTSARPGPGTDRAVQEITIDRKDQLLGGAGFGGPLGFQASFGLLRGLGADVRDDDGRVKAVCAVPIPHCAGGFLLQADAGSGGGKLSLGVGARARVDEEDFHGAVAAAFKVSAARTWGHPVGTEPGLTYVGPELDLTVWHVGTSIGVLWRVAGEGGSSALFTWGLGFRL
jgi:hypothetical protein